MGIVQTSFFYLLIGISIAVADMTTARRSWLPSQLIRFLSVCLFWPLFLPTLLARNPRTTPSGLEAHGPASEAPRDELSEAIDRVEAELDQALSSLEGWAEDVLARENDRLHELRSVWRHQAERIRQMDRLLVQSESTQPRLPEGSEVDQRLRQGEPGRRANLERLREVRLATFEELMHTLVWVRELTSMLYLAKFTGAPVTRAEELVSQIAAAVEGVSFATRADVRPSRTEPTEVSTSLSP